MNYDISVNERALNSKVNFIEHPFYQTIMCLTDPKSGNAHTFDKDLFIQKNNELLNFLTKNGQNNIKNIQYKNAKYFQENAEDYFKYNSGCDFGIENVLDGRNQLMEAIADKVSAEIVNRMLKNKNEKDANNAILEIAFGYSESCPNVNAKTNYLKELGKKYNCKNFIDNKNKDERIVIQMKEVGVTNENAAYLSPFVRINNILMAHPEIRKKLNCKEDKGVKYCD
jgi:hypothetical protein